MKGGGGGGLSLTGGFTVPPGLWSQALPHSQPHPRDASRYALSGHVFAYCEF